MENQFGYKLIKVKGILCSAAFFLGMVFSVASAAVTVNEGGAVVHTNIATTGDISTYSTAQAAVDTTQDASIASNAAVITTNTASIASNAAVITTNTASIASNAAVITTNTASIASNAAVITTNTASIASNAAVITTNTASIASNAAVITTNTASIASNATEIGINTASIASNATEIGINTASIASNAVSIASNGAEIALINSDPTNGQVEVLTATIGLGGLTVQGATQLDGALNVDGATTTNGITNTGDIATGTLQTTGLATLNSAQVNTTLNVDGATTLNAGVAVTGGDSSFTSADGLSNLTVENGEVFAGTTDSELSLSDAEVSLTLNNGVSDHGLVVTTTSTTLSGGATSSQMVLDDNGATFSEVGSGDPITVTGVADGVSTYDAVNKGQLDALEGKLQNQIDDNTSGIAAVAAMANIPAPLPGHKYSMGVGYGNFQGEQAIAFGGTAMVNDSVNLKLSAGVSGSDVTIGAGAGISWQ